jgi:hypothetical protein
VESKERDETPDKTNLWTEYQRLLARNVPEFPETAYCGRRSLLYGLPTEELQRYFEERTGDIEELEEKLKAWHAKEFPLLEIKSAKFYVYGWSVSENGDRKIKRLGREVYYPADGSSNTPSLKITMDDLFGDDKTTIQDNIVSIGNKTAAVPFPIEDLRAQIDKGIKQHIANTIEMLTDDLEAEYLHWKQPHPTTTDVAEEDQAVRRTATPYSLRDTIRRTFKSKYSSKVGNDKKAAQHVIQNDRQEEGTDTSLLAGSIHGELQVPRQRQHPTFVHDPSPELPVDEPTSQSAPVPSADQTASKGKKRSISDGTDVVEKPLKKIMGIVKRIVSGGSNRGSG